MYNNNKCWCMEGMKVSKVHGIVVFFCTFYSHFVSFVLSLYKYHLPLDESNSMIHLSLLSTSASGTSTPLSSLPLQDLNALLSSHSTIFFTLCSTVVHCCRRLCRRKHWISIDSNSNSFLVALFYLTSLLLINNRTTPT